MRVERRADAAASGVAGALRLGAIADADQSNPRKYLMCFNVFYQQVRLTSRLK